MWNFMKLLHDTLIKWTGITTKYLFADVQFFKLFFFVFFCRKTKQYERDNGDLHTKGI